MLRLVEVVVHIVDALPQLLVQRHAVAMLGDFRSHALRDSHERVVGIGREHGIEHSQHTVEHFARALKRHDGVLKGGGRLLVGNSLDFGTVTFHSLDNSLLVVGSSDAVEGYSAVSSLKRLEKNIVGTNHSCNRK